MLALLHRTRSLSYATARKYASHAPTNNVPQVVPMRGLDLPPPEPITPQLIALGVEVNAAQRISAALAGTASELKRRFEDDYQHRQQTVQHRAAYFQDPQHASLIPSTYALIYSKTVQEWKTYVFRNFAPRFLQACNYKRSQSDSSSDEGHSRKRPFNQSAVPILERFFETNAFPSRLEKHELAAKCSMEYRQIHVWFQNRRSRGRKEGKELRKRDCNNALALELENAVINALLPTEADEEGDAVDVDTSRTNHTPFAVQDAPAHAFPSPYPPLCSYNPFPIAMQERALSLPWPRTRATTSRTPSGAVDISELTTAFTKLALTDKQSSGRNAAPARSSDGHGAHKSAFGFITHCHRAPHPALLPHPRLPATTATPILSSTLRRLGHTFSQSSALPYGKKVDRGLILSSALPPFTGIFGEKSKRSLPRRMPRHAPGFPLAPAKAPSYRSSSSSSTSSQTSVGSKYSTSESDSDSPLATPPSIQTSLPLVHSPHHQEEGYLDVLRDVLPSKSSPLPPNSSWETMFAAFMTPYIH